MKQVIAIDGPAGAGKSTVAKLAAARLGYTYIDTGAMYRACALAVLRAGVDPQDEAAVTQIAAGCHIRMENQDGVYRYYLNEEDVSEAIRTPEVTVAVTPVSATAGVRQYMVAEQRRMAASGRVVLDGRDIGSKVLPDADCKIFLTASVAERAKRRWLEMQTKGYALSLEEVEADIVRRDTCDSTRKESPLVRVPDAVLLDTSDMEIDEVVGKIVAMAEGD